MSKRVIFITLGIVMITLGCTGIVLFQQELRRQEDRFRAKAAIEQGNIEYERNRAQELEKQLGEEKQKASDAQLKLAEEQNRREETEATIRKQKEELAQRRKAAIEARDTNRKVVADAKAGNNDVLKPRGPESKIEQMQKSRSAGREELEQAQRQTTKDSQSVIVRFRLYPQKSKVARIAHVHLGDRVKIRINRIGDADATLYAGLAPLDIIADASPSYHRTPSFKSRPVVVTPLDDYDQFAVSLFRGADQRVVNSIDSRDGAILSIGFHPDLAGRLSGGPYAERSSFFEIEAIIETGNRWGIKPRSLL